MENFNERFFNLYGIIGNIKEVVYGFLEKVLKLNSFVIKLNLEGIFWES